MQNKLDMLRIFSVAAASRNFKEAAQRLGISPQAVTRAVRELELQMGEVLFHRNTRQCRITEAGEQLAIEAEAGLAAIDRVFRQKSSFAEAEIDGLVRITAPEVIGQDSLVVVLAGLQRQHPGLRFDLHLADEETNVVDEKIDIGIRHGVMRDSRFVARSVAMVPYYIVAAPALIQRVGTPTSLAELMTMPVTGTLDPGTGKPWPWLFREGQQWLPSQQTFLSNSASAECAAVLQGMGFAQLPGFLACPHLQAGTLVPVLADESPSPWPLSIFRPQREPVSVRVRTTFDWLVQAFSMSYAYP